MEFLNLSELYFPAFENGDYNESHFRVMLWELNEILHVKYIELAYSTLSIKVGNNIVFFFFPPQQLGSFATFS